jgi:hypothetical protein
MLVDQASGHQIGSEPPVGHGREQRASDSALKGGGRESARVH